MKYGIIWESLISSPISDTLYPLLDNSIALAFNPVAIVSINHCLRDCFTCTVLEKLIGIGIWWRTLRPDDLTQVHLNSF